MARLQTGLGALVALAILLTLASCGPPDVNQLRQSYAAELNTWFKVDTPAVAEAVITVEGEEAGETEGVDGEDGEEEEAGDSTADEMIDEMPETLSVSQKVTLDILLSHNGAGELPVITLDIYQADSEGNEKQNWKLPVDTTDLAGGKQITETLEGVEVAPGDQFAVEVRAFVPPEEQSEYQEFSAQPES